MTARLLEIENLRVRMPHLAPRPLLDGVSLHVGRGEVVGLVGESGSGKSVTARTTLGLLPPRAEVEGRVLVDGTDVLTARKDDVRKVRTSKAAMVFQDPRAGMNPLRRIGDFMTESARQAGSQSASAARSRALELLEAVGLPDPPRHLRQHPHELSGGMLQRVMIATALMGHPELLLCDEPTTALDVTTQAEILSILKGLQGERGMGILFITHDLDLAASLCDRVYVMYAGRVVEEASADQLFADPRHPYTAGLLGSTPAVDRDDDQLHPVQGAPLSLFENPPGCAFATRCEHVVEAVCTTQVPELTTEDGHAVRCARAGQLAAELAATAGHARSAS